MSIVIRSSKDGFRRCGEFHSKNPVTWPEDRFNKKEQKLLLAEPKLSVQIVPEKTDKLKDKAKTGAGAKSNTDTGSQVEPKLSVTINQGAKAPATKEKTIEKPTDNSLSDPEKSAPVAKDVAPEVLEAALRAISDGNTIKSGAPDIKAMEQILGRDVDAAERDQAWELVQTKAETKTQDKVEE